MILLYQDINVPTFLLNQCIPDFLLALESFIFVLLPFVYALCDTSNALSFGGLPGI